MWLFDIGLHKISLGALILSLGLLVDDAIIAVEMMAIKMEQGFDRFRAASFAYTSTAFPMLTGTLVTVAGFLPIATAQEQHRRVHALDLPGVGDRADRVVGGRGRRAFRTSATRCCRTARSAHAPSLRRAAVGARRPAGRRPRRAARTDDRRRLPDAVLHALPRASIAWCVGHRKTVLVATLAIFVGALGAVPLRAAAVLPGVVARRAAGRPAAARRQLVRGDAGGRRRSSRRCSTQEPGIESYVTYVGSGSAALLPAARPAAARSRTSRSSCSSRRASTTARRCATRLLALFDDDFPELRGRVSRLENGPPVGFPGAVPRVRRGHRDRARASRSRWPTSCATIPTRRNVQFDWDEPSKVDPPGDRPEQGARARHLVAGPRGVPQQLAVRASRSRTYRERDKQIEVLLRGAADERARMSFLKDLAIPSRNGRAVPITQIADIEYELEDGIVWRRNRLPTITVRADVRGDAQGPDVAKRIEPAARRDPRGAAARLPHRAGRRHRGFGARAEVDRRRHAAARPRRADAADDPAAELLAHADGGADRAARPDRRRRSRCSRSASRSASSRCSARSRCPASSCATR